MKKSIFEGLNFSFKKHVGNVEDRVVSGVAITVPGFVVSAFKASENMPNSEVEQEPLQSEFDMHNTAPESNLRANQEGAPNAENTLLSLLGKAKEICEDPMTQMLVSSAFENLSDKFARKRDVSDSNEGVENVEENRNGE